MASSGREREGIEGHGHTRYTGNIQSSPHFSKAVNKKILSVNLLYFQQLSSVYVDKTASQTLAQSKIRHCKFYTYKCLRQIACKIHPFFIYFPIEKQGHTFKWWNKAAKTDRSPWIAFFFFLLLWVWIRDRGELLKRLARATGRKTKEE